MNKEKGTVYNWEKHKGPRKPVRTPREYVEIDDETLRDGLQGVQLDKHPTTELKKVYLDLIWPFVDHLDIGFPGSQGNHKKEILELVGYSLSRGHEVTFSCAARGAVRVDVAPIVDLSQELGDKIEADIFFDPSTFRAAKEGWDRKEMIKLLAENIKFLKDNNLPVMFVAERATAAPPDELSEIFQVAVDLGADRLCIADTNGKSGHREIENIFRWSLNNFGNKHPQLKWDAHFHNDRGLALSNSLTAAEEGADRIHATMFCIGERAGNVDLALLFVNLNLEGFRQDDSATIKRLDSFAKAVSGLMGYEIPPNTPVYGDHAFATASGVHASATLKESHAGIDHKIYFPFDPSFVGRTPQVEVGPFSGRANVQFKLEELGIESTEEMIIEILSAAKDGRGLLTDGVIGEIAKRYLGEETD